MASAWGDAWGSAWGVSWGGTTTTARSGAHAGGKFKGRIKYWWEKPDPVEFDMPYRPPPITNPVEPFKASGELERKIEVLRRKRKRMIGLANVIRALMEDEDLDL